jgi:hypothetical protein
MIFTLMIVNSTPFGVETLFSVISYQMVRK